MKKKFIFISLSILLCSELFATVQSGENITTQRNEDGINTRATSRELSPEPQNKNIKNYDEVVYQHILTSQRGQRELEADTSPGQYAFDAKAERETKEKAAKAERLALLQKAEEKTKKELKDFTRFGSGYCFLDKEVFVQRIATYAYFTCDFAKPFGKVQLATSLVPEFFAKALIGNPLYVIKDGKRFPIKNGVVMTKDRNSINLANFVDDRQTERISATVGYKGLGTLAQSAQAFLEQKNLADTEETVVTDSNGLGNTTTGYRRVAQPDPFVYLINAGVQFASESAKIIGEAYTTNLPYIFKVNKGSIFYVDVQFADDVNMEGYKIIQDNIIKKEPTYIDGVATNQITETVGVRNNHGGQDGTEKVTSSGRASKKPYTLPPSPTTSSKKSSKKKLRSFLDDAFDIEGEQR